MPASVVGRLAFLATLVGAAAAAGPAAAGGCYGSECYRRVVAPPLYDTVTEQHLISPPRTVYRTTAPVFETVTDRVLVAPGGRAWQTYHDAHGHLIGCWVAIPDRFGITGGSSADVGVGLGFTAGSIYDGY